MALTDVSLEYATLLAKASRTSRGRGRLKALDARIEAGNGEVSDFFRNTLYPELAQKAGTVDANALLNKEKSDVSQLQNTLAGLGPRVLGIRLLLGEDHAYAIAITAHTREKVELKATPAELRSKVLEVRDDLRIAIVESQAASGRTLRDGRRAARAGVESAGIAAGRVSAPLCPRCSGRSMACCAMCPWPRSTTAHTIWSSASTMCSSPPRATATWRAPG